MIPRNRSIPDFRPSDRCSFSIVGSDLTRNSALDFLPENLATDGIPNLNGDAMQLILR